MDYANDIVLLTNATTQGETLLQSLEWAVGGIGLHVNTDKMEYVCFNQRGDILILKGGPLKLVDKFTYLGSSVSSTKTDINTRLEKAWTAIDRLSIIWKSNLTDKIKQFFFQSSGCVDTAIWMHYMGANWTYGEKAWRQLHKNSGYNIEQVLEATPYKRAAIRPPTTHHENYPS